MELLWVLIMIMMSRTELAVDSHFEKRKLRIRCFGFVVFGHDVNSPAPNGVF